SRCRPRPRAPACSDLPDGREVEVEDGFRLHPLGAVLLPDADDLTEDRHVEAVALGLGVDLLDVLGDLGLVLLQALNPLDDRLELGLRRGVQDVGAVAVVADPRHQAAALGLRTRFGLAGALGSAASASRAPRARRPCEDRNFAGRRSGWACCAWMMATVARRASCFRSPRVSRADWPSGRLTHRQAFRRLPGRPLRKLLRSSAGVSVPTTLA